MKKLKVKRIYTILSSQKDIILSIMKTNKVILLSAIAKKAGHEFDIRLLPSTLFAILAFAFNTGAYMSESFRSSLVSVEAGQFEACKSLHYSTWDSLRRIILPQAFVIAIPTLTSSFLAMIKKPHIC